jgi:hypothetical protein
VTFNVLQEWETARLFYVILSKASCGVVLPIRQKDVFITFVPQKPFVGDLQKRDEQV